MHLYDEHWFILVHVDIEALAARILDAIAKVEIALSLGERNIVDDALWAIARAVSDQAKVLRRIPEKMDPALYYKTFRPYIRFFENVFYEATEQRPIADSDGHAPAMVRMNLRGETGAQSSIMPTLVAFMKIPHRPSMLTNHLADMRNYMPAEHRHVIEAVEAMPSIRELADRQDLQCSARRNRGLPRGSLRLGSRVHQPLDRRSARDGWHALHGVVAAAHRRDPCGSCATTRATCRGCAATSTMPNRRRTGAARD